jgi:hypothetical protein
MRALSPAHSIHLDVITLPTYGEEYNCAVFSSLLPLLTSSCAELIKHEIHVFLISAVVRSVWSVSCPSRCIPGERALGNHWTGGWVGPRTGLDDAERRNILPLSELELRPLGRSTRSVSYPQSMFFP